MIYQLYKTVMNQDAVTTVGVNPQKSFIFAPDNPDYQQFKKDIMDGGELQDADGVVMTPEAAQEFITSLP